MNFPAYVPVAVRRYVTTLIEGGAFPGDAGWKKSLAGIERRLSDIDDVLIDFIQHGQEDELSCLRQHRMAVVEEQERLVGDIACVERLVHDTRMKAVYELLATVFSDAMEWEAFFDAAWSARLDVKANRDQLKAAVALKREIADTAKKLAQLIDSFQALGLHGPDEFFSVFTLFQKAEMPQSHKRKFMDRHILGALSQDEASPISPEALFAATAGGDAVKIGVTEAIKIPLPYAWEGAPAFSRLLYTVATAAQRFEPSEHGGIGEAVDSRQANQKTEYLRAFVYYLLDAHHLTPSPQLISATAVTANVAINLAHIDVSRDDCTKAVSQYLEKVKETAGGNS